MGNDGIMTPIDRTHSLIQLDKSYKNLFGYWVSETGLYRANGFWRIILWILDKAGFRTCCDIFTQMMNLLLQDIDQEKIQELTKTFFTLDLKELKHVQRVFQRCLDNQIVDTTICSRVAEKIEEAKFFQLKAAIEKIDEGVIHAPVNVLGFFNKFYEQRGESIRCFIKAFKQQDGKHLEEAMELKQEEEFGFWKEDTAFREIYENIQRFCQNEMAEKMGSGEFQHQGLKKKFIYQRYLQLSEKTKEDIVQVASENMRVAAVVNEGQKKLVYSMRWSVKLMKDLQAEKVSCEASIEWDVLCGQLTFNPGYNFEVHKECTLEELELLNQMLFYGRR